MEIAWKLCINSDEEEEGHQRGEEELYQVRSDDKDFLFLWYNNVTSAGSERRHKAFIAQTGDNLVIRCDVQIVRGRSCQKTDEMSGLHPQYMLSKRFPVHAAIELQDLKSIASLLSNEKDARYHFDRKLTNNEVMISWTTFFLLVDRMNIEYSV